jgi:Cu(I)/Ag(I) efflux system protein CusF
VKLNHVLAAILLTTGLSLSAMAAETPGASGQAGAHLADGEVRKVDKDAKKLTIRHGPLPQFDMPTPMTMVYQVKDAALLDQVKPGDKIRFEAEKIGGLFTVIRIDPVK